MATGDSQFAFRHKKKYGEKSVSKDREDGETAHEQEGHREYGAGNDLTVQIKAGYIPVNYGVSGECGKAGSSWDSPAREPRMKRVPPRRCVGWKSFSKPKIA